MSLLRLRAMLSGLWAGMLVTLGAVAAPTLFALLDRSTAGRVAGRYFFIESRASILLAVAIIVIERVRVRGQLPEGRVRQFSAELMLTLVALLCTIVGYDVLHPMMEAARAGQGGTTFGLLHGLSSSLFAIKGALVLALLWRCCGSRG